MKEKRIKILLVDQAETVLALGKTYLKKVGFDVITAANAEKALVLIAKENPKVVIIEAGLPNPSGFEITKKLKNDIVTYHIPIILSTNLENKDFVDKAIAVGADDFILKPFNPDDIYARVQMVLKRLVRERFCHPLTGLAGSVYIENKIEQKIKAAEDFAICYADINNFRCYNLKYNFSKGDEVIKTTGKIINMVLRRFPSHECFLGHLGGGRFVFITPIDIVESVCSRVVKSFDEVSASFYNATDNKRGYVQVKNRTGGIEKIPLITLSIGVVTSQNRIIEHLAIINDIAVELKKYAKTFNDSIFVVDRRTQKREG